VVDVLTRLFDEHFGATWTFEADPVEAAHRMIDHIDRKRAALGLPPPMYEVPYPPRANDAAPRSASPPRPARRGGGSWSPRSAWGPTLSDALRRRATQSVADRAFPRGTVGTRIASIIR